MKEDENNWPEPDRVGMQELEIVMGNEHISFTTSKIGLLVDVQSSKDPEGLHIFYYLVQGVCVGCEWHPLEQSKVATCGWDVNIHYWERHYFKPMRTWNTWP